LFFLGVYDEKNVLFGAIGCSVKNRGDPSIH